MITVITCFGTNLWANRWALWRRAIVMYRDIGDSSRVCVGHGVLGVAPTDVFVSTTMFNFKIAAERDGGLGRRGCTLSDHRRVRSPVTGIRAW